METAHYDSEGRQKVRVWQPPTINVRATKALTTGNNDVDIDLPTGKTINKVTVYVGAVTGVPVLTLYNGAVVNAEKLADADGNVHVDAAYIITQSADGFKIGNKATADVLGVRIAGLASGSGTAYINVECI
jgi:hypothetical protein